MTECLGVFDSGFGGLTVLKELLKANTYKRIIYFGDTGRVPYGTRSRETIVRYARQDMRFLLSRGAQEVVIACNTVSANAMEELQQEFDVPIHGMIEASAPAAARATRNGKIGVIGTAATVRNGAYERALKAMDPALQITSVACPLFVPLVEYGFTEPENAITAAACEHYLKELKEAGVDTVILGCTHYPVIEAAIGRFLGAGVKLINNGVELSRLMDRGSAPLCTPELEFYVSDDPADFDKNRALFMPGPYPSEAKKIDIQIY